MNSKNIDRAKQSKSFCILPFTHVATKTYGDIKLCCRSLPVGNIKEQPLSSIWNSDRYRQIRKDMLSGERPAECNICWNQEDVGVISMRQRLNNERSYMSPQLSKCNDEYAIPFEIPVLELKLSNFCNLKCRMCHPLDSTSWFSDWKTIEHLMATNNKGTYDKVNKMTSPYLSAWDDETFWKEFDELLPHFRIIEFAGGEPLIDPIHYKVLEKLAPYGHQIQLKYATNLTNIVFGKTKIFDIWDNFSEVHLHVSIDGMGDMYDYIRQGANWQQLIDNIDAVSQRRNVVMSPQITVQIYNIHQLPEFFDFFTERMECKLVSHRVDFPKFLSIKCLPPKYKAKIIAQLEEYATTIVDKTHVRWTDQKKTHVYDLIYNEIKILKSHDNSKLLKDFVEFSNTLDNVQSVKLTWKELLGELHTELQELKI